MTTDRQRAIEILQRARDVLVQRLAGRIQQAADEILEEAAGERYLSEIDTIYDELGARLAHVSSMLTHLPPAEWERSAAADEAEPTSDAGPATDEPPGEMSAAFAPRGFLALPPPPRPQRGALLSPSHHLHGFLQNVHRGELATAAVILGLLFELDAVRAQRATDVFAVQAALRPELYTRVMRLRSELAGNGGADPGLLLCECFGLTPAEAAAVVKALDRRLSLTGDARVT